MGDGSPATVAAKDGHTVPPDPPIPTDLTAEHIRQRFELLSPWLDEKQRRLLAAGLSQALWRMRGEGASVGDGRGRGCGQ